VEGSVERGVNPENASYIFDLMEKFAGYGFNKSHSAAYALITYQTAWLKTHYKAAFMAAVLSSDMAHTDKVVTFIEDARLQKLTILPPNVNQSLYKFSVAENDCIFYGLGAIKGVGEAAIASIIEARQERPFQDIFDFCARVDGRRVSRRVLEALIRSGAFDCFGLERSALMASLEDAVTAAEQLTKNRARGQVDLFGDSLSASDVLSAQPAQVEPWPDSIRLQGEKETLGLYLTGHPLEQYEKELRSLTTTVIRDLKAEKNRRQIIAGILVAIRTLQTKKGDRMAFITIDDRTGRQEVAVFSDHYHQNKELLVKDALVVVVGEVSIDDFSGGYKMRCLEVFSLEKARMKSAKLIKIKLSGNDINETFSQSLVKLLEPYKHEEGCQVQLIYQRVEAEVLLKLADGWNISPAQTLLDDLKYLSGIDCVDVEY